MPRALITDIAAATNPGAAPGAAATAGSGSTLTIRNGALTSKVLLTDLWRKGGTAGLVQLTSPKLVPVSHGIQVDAGAGLGDFLLPGAPYQQLIPQDDLTMNLSGGGAETDVGVIQSYYDDLPASGMKLVMPGDIEGQTQFKFGYAVPVTSSATIGDQAGAAVTAGYDGTDANRWYAVMGYVTDTELATVGIQGTDTSQLYIAGPGDVNPVNTSRYFADLSMATGRPCVPLWNAANKANTNVVVTDDAASTAANVTLVLAQLVKDYSPPTG